MQNIFDIEKNKIATIEKITALGDLRERFISFGITKGSQIVVTNCSPNCENIEITIEGTFLALRKDEAKEIWVC